MQDIFAEIKKRLKIKEVIEYYHSSLFKRDKCNCPFHNDKNASLSIRESTNTFKCFGCGESGSAIDFVMRLKKIDKFEASKLICRDFNLNIQFEKTKPKEESIKSYILRCEKDIDQEV